MVKREGEGSKQMIAVNRGAWAAEEDKKLVDYVRVHGDRNWRLLPIKAGLNRCGKSCRLRWLNYLRPGIKRGNISEDEEDLIIRLHNLLGNRWSLIAGRLPGRTDNEIKNHWNTHLSKKALTMNDLNSKLHKRLESIAGNRNSSGTAPQTPMTPPRASACPVLIVEPPKGSPSLSDARSQAEEMCRQVLDVNEILDLPVPLPEYNCGIMQCPYQSLSRVLIQQPLPREEDGLSFEELAGLVDYRDYLLHLLRS